MVSDGNQKNLLHYAAVPDQPPINLRAQEKSPRFQLVNRNQIMMENTVQSDEENGYTFLYKKIFFDRKTFKEIIEIL